MNSPSIQAVLAFLATAFIACSSISSAGEVAILADSTYVDNGSGEAAANIGSVLHSAGISSTPLTDFDARDLADWEALFESYDVFIIPELVKNRLSGHLDAPEATFVRSQLAAGKRLILCGSLENEDALNFMEEVFGWTIEGVAEDGIGKTLEDRRFSWLRTWVDVQSAGDPNQPVLILELEAPEGTALVEQSSLPAEVEDLRGFSDSFRDDEGQFVRIRETGVFASSEMAYLGWNYSDLAFDGEGDWSLLLQDLMGALPGPNNTESLNLDAGFGSGGLTVTSTPVDAATFDGPRQHRAITLLPDGSILATGAGEGPTFAAWKYRPDGTLDSTFGNNGTVGIAVAPFTEDYEEEYRQESAFAIATDAAGNIFLTGRILNGIENEGETQIYDVGVVKLLPDGQLDPSFGDAGVQILSAVTGEEIYPQDDGKILIVARENFEDRNSTSPEGEAVVFRLLANGDLDTSYGVDGRRRIPGLGSAHRAQLAPC